MDLLCDLLESSDTLQQQMVQTKGFLVISHLLQEVNRGSLWTFSIILSYNILYYITLHHIIYHISYHIISYHIISYHIISYHIISYYWIDKYCSFTLISFESQHWKGAPPLSCCYLLCGAHMRKRQVSLWRILCHVEWIGVVGPFLRLSWHQQGETRERYHTATDLTSDSHRDWSNEWCTKLNLGLVIMAS